MLNLKKWTAALCAAACLAIIPSFGEALAQSSTKVIFSLDFIPLGRHAPWYVALDKGYYADVGLDVKIIPSKGTAQTVQAIESGNADIGFVDVASVALGRARGATLKLVAIMYQKAPYAIFSLKSGADVTTADQLEGLALGSGAGSFTPKIIRGFMAQHGLDPDSLEIVNVAPPARASMLLSGEVPAIEFYVMSKPGLESGAKRIGTGLSTFLLADHGLVLYSNGIATTESYLEDHPEVVKKFVQASLRGWQYALEHPEEAARIQTQYVDGLDGDVIVKELAVVESLAVTDDTKAHGLGWFDPEKMKSSLDFIVKYIGVPGEPPAAEDLYAEGFLPESPINP